MYVVKISDVNRGPNVRTLDPVPKFGSNVSYPRVR